jgi:HEAT repeat protein
MAGALNMSLDTLLPALADASHAPPASELAALSNISGDERERFVDVWRTLSIQRRREVIDDLATLAEDNVEMDFSEVFLLSLFDDDVQVRTESVKALWEYEDDHLVPILLQLLADPEAMVRAEAALGLGRYLLRDELTSDDAESPEIEEALRRVVHDETELSEVRGRALEALGGLEWVRDLIDEAYSSGDRRMQISAVHAMGRNADSSWLPMILEEMNSDDGEMRFEAATAAGALGDEEAIPYLAQLTGDEDPEVQEAAISALGMIGGPSARSVLTTVASEQRDERILEAVSDALAEADFIEDPLGYKLYLDRSVADDADEDDDE